MQASREIARGLPSQVNLRDAKDKGLRNAIKTAALLSIAFSQMNLCAYIGQIYQNKVVVEKDRTVTSLSWVFF